MPVAEGSAKFVISADARQFTSELAKAQQAAETAFSKIQAVAGPAKAALGFLGVGLSVGAFVSSIKGAIDSLDKLYDVSLRTGASVEALSAFRSVAKLSGTEMETLASGIQKLSRAMAGSEEEGQKAGVVFQRLGIAVTDSAGKLRPAEDVLVEVAKKLDGMENATQRVAFAQQIFGKSGAQLLPFLNELAQTGALNAKVTTEQAEAADRFNDNLVKLTAQSNKWKVELANELLPTMNDFLEKFLALKKAFDGSTLKATIAFASVSGNEENDINGAIGNVETKLKKLRVLREELTKPTLGNRLNNFFGTDVETVDQQIAGFEAKLKALGAVRDQQLGGLSDAFGKNPRRSTQVAEAPAGPAAESEFDKAKKRLQEEIIKVQDLTRAEEVLREVQFGKYGKLTAEQANELKRMAERATLLKQQAEDEKALTTANEQAVRERDQRIAKEFEEAQKEIADATALMWKQVFETIDMEQDAAVQKSLDYIKQIEEEQKTQAAAAKELFAPIQSAFEEAVIQGKKLSEVLKGVAQDVAKIIFRKSVTNPLAEAGTKIFGDLFKGLFGGGRADGGPVSGGTPYVVGERGPELFVPRGSGTIVPNGAMGGGSMAVSLTINAVDAPGVARLLSTPEAQRTITAVMSRAYDRAARPTTFRA